MVPGVLIGGQVAPYLASKAFFADEEVELFVVVLLCSVGVVFAIKAIVG